MTINGSVNRWKNGADFFLSHTYVINIKVGSDRSWFQEFYSCVLVGEGVMSMGRNFLHRI